MNSVDNNQCVFETSLIEMSSLLNYNNCCFIDHSKYVSQLYENVLDDKSRLISLAMINKLFCMKFKKTNENCKENFRKRKRNTCDYSSETLTIQELYNNFIKKFPDEYGVIEDKELSLTAIKEVRDLAQHLFETTIFENYNISGGNNGEIPLKVKVQNDYFLIPQKSRFLCGDVKEQCQKLGENKYDLLVADPPWWNKYIRRLKSANDKLCYSMMYNEDIADIPVKNLLATNCLVAVWCTNAPSNVDAVKNIIFPRWGIEFVTTWYWLKVTMELKPLCPFSAGCKKQPYERLMIGKIGQVKDIPKEKLIISVPSALHSHKPPLLDILKPYLDKENPETLELFARYLLPNTTSVGYEPLKWQHISLYELRNKQ